MINPILKHRRSWFYFLSIALLLCILHALLLYYFYKIPVQLAILDSLVFNIPFCALALNSWYIVKYIDVDSFKPVTIIANHFVTAIMAITLWLLAGIMIFKLLKSISQPHLDFIFETLPARFLLGLLLYSGVILLYYSFNYYSNLQEKTHKESQLKALVKEAELNVLKSQINPHFIFNSLNSISSLTILNPAQAREMIIKLSEFLRYALDQDMKQKTLLRDESDNIKRYLEIEKIRFGERLKYDLNISPEANKAFLPNMILQPLLENAIKHGVHESTEPIHIQVGGKTDNDYLVVNIKNNYDPEGQLRKKSGIGLKNIQNRLELIYNRRDLFKINSDGRIFEVQILFPQTFPRI